MLFTVLKTGFERVASIIIETRWKEMVNMKKIYLEKQFMKAKNLDNYIIGEFVGSSQERGVHKIKQEDGNILYVLSHSLLGWEDYTEKHKKETKADSKESVQK